jgi:hypothetical protein
VRDALELPEHAELAEVGGVDPPDLEHAVRADADTLGLALALAAIDDRGELTRLSSALRISTTPRWF